MVTEMLCASCWILTSFTKKRSDWHSSTFSRTLQHVSRCEVFIKMSVFLFVVKTLALCQLCAASLVVTWLTVC